MTRARKLAVIVGSKKALAIAVGNKQIQKRYTLLRERLMGLLEGRQPMREQMTI
jgi:exodeoxyribonuclease V alpha subunit